MNNIIFLEEKNLLPSYIPPTLPHREEEIKSVATNFRGLFDNKRNKGMEGKSTNLLIIGPPGIGKTAISRFVLDQLIRVGQEKKLMILGCYVNCWQHRSFSAILSETFTQLNISDVSTKGYSLEEQAAEIIMPYLEERTAHLILVLDEINALNSDDLNSLHAISEEFGERTRISLILVCRPTDWHLLSADLNLRMTEQITLYPYNYEEVVKIIQYRASIALQPTAFDEELIEQVADIAFHDHNIRLGLEIIYRAGYIAMKQSNEGFIDSEMIRKAKSLVFPELRSEVLDELKVHELYALIGIARRLVNRTFTSLNLMDAFRYYKIACAEHGEIPKKESTFRRYLNTLRTLGLINMVVSATGRGKRGIRARISIMDCPATIVIERVEEQLDLIDNL